MSDRRRGKRRSSTETDTIQQRDQASTKGVGARRSGSTPPGGGGGYQNSCTILNFGPPPHAGDPRLDELRAMGLRKVWLDVAAIVGFDAFLAMWRRFDAEPGAVHDDGRLELRIRSYRSYLRFQRNKYIETLYASGLDEREIQARVKKSLRESLSVSHISKVARRG